MHHIDLSSWEQFEEQLKALAIQRRQRQAAVALSVSGFLFRGQADHSWRLETTLERQMRERMAVADYYRTISAAKPQIETFTGLTWDIPELPQYQEWLEDQDSLTFGGFPAYEYFVYLRHHGFPSPLLDWTRSPYVAAFFAFRNASAPTEKVSIYAYCEYFGGGKAWMKSAPHIESLGPYVRGHRRHFLQQSEYTICSFWNRDQWEFACHENALGDGESSHDRLWKFTLPCSEKLKVLRQLDSYNLNAFSLFASEETLMETMLFREFHVRGADL